ncbi:hypothetical protein Tco_0099582 [Tanacetum coccineum]
MDLDFVADEKLRELSGEEAWEAIENYAQGQKEWDNQLNIISEQEVANLKAQAKRLFGNENFWVEMHRGSFSKKTKRKFCSEAGDGVRIYPDGVVIPASEKFKKFQVIFDEKKLGSS